MAALLGGNTIMGILIHISILIRIGILIRIHSSVWILFTARGIFLSQNANSKGIDI